MKEQLKNWIIINSDNNDEISVKCYAMIKNNEIDEIRRYETDEYFYSYDLDKSHPSIFLWDEGNFSCDCNRRLFWLRANNENDNIKNECTDGKFSVNLFNAKNDECYYAEFATDDLPIKASFFENLNKSPLVDEYINTLRENFMKDFLKNYPK